MEADAVEADFSIVSAMDKEQSIGRPIVYFLLDVQTSAIVAVSNFVGKQQYDWSYKSFLKSGR